MNHWLRDATQAAHYARHGWPTVDTSSRVRQNHDARIQKYEQSLSDMLNVITRKPQDIVTISALVGIKPSTGKNHIAALLKREKIEVKREYNPNNTGRKPRNLYFVR